MKLIRRLIYAILILNSIAPFWVLFYVQRTASATATDFISVLRNDPSVTIWLLSACLLPLMAYVIKLRWDQANHQGKLVLMNQAMDLEVSLVAGAVVAALLSNYVQSALSLSAVYLIGRQLGWRAMHLNKQRWYYHYSGEITFVLLALGVRWLQSRL